MRVHTYQTVAIDFDELQYIVVQISPEVEIWRFDLEQEAIEFAVQIEQTQKA